MLKARADQKVMVVSKNINRAIALMSIKIDDQDSLKMMNMDGAQTTDSDVVEKAKAFASLVFGVVAGRSNASKSIIVTSVIAVSYTNLTLPTDEQGWG